MWITALEKLKNSFQQTSKLKTKEIMWKNGSQEWDFIRKKIKEKSSPFPHFPIRNANPEKFKRLLVIFMS